MPPTAQPPPPDEHLAMLDVLRGLAASMVFIAHFFFLYAPAMPPELAGVSQVVNRHFPRGVPLFYALSGLALCLGYFSRRTAPGFCRGFFIRRFFRIAPLFYLVLAATVANQWAHGARVTAGQVLANVTFTFGLIPGLHESLVVAGWSIGVEMMFYLLFPFLVAVITNRLRAAGGLLFSAILAAVAYAYFLRGLPQIYYAQLSFYSYGHFFATGILVFFLYEAGKNRGGMPARRLSWILLGLFLATLLALVFRLPAQVPWLDSVPVKRTLWAIPMGLLLWLACTVSIPVRWIRPFVWMGKCSYSLYLVHPLVLYFVFRWFPLPAPVAGSGAGRFLGLFAVSTLLLLAVSALTYRWVEWPFMELARRLTRKAPQPARTQVAGGA
jgi:peptidoglycan/LPS O-acetylase OafA/YrhL